MASSRVSGSVDMPLLFEHTPAIFEGWKITLMAVAASGAAGLAAGILYRFGAAVVLTFITAVTGFLLSENQGYGFWQSVLYAFGMITALQICYLVGVALSGNLSRAAAKGSLRGAIAALFKQKTAP
jgi:hypothetical protein